MENYISDVIASKDVYNESEQVIVCPIINNKIESVVVAEITYEKQTMYVECDKLKHVDLREKHSKSWRNKSIRLHGSIGYTTSYIGVCVGYDACCIDG